MYDRQDPPGRSSVLHAKSINRRGTGGCLFNICAVCIGKPYYCWEPRVGPAGWASLFGRLAGGVAAWASLFRWLAGRRAAMEASPDDVYPLKRIVFYQRPVQIVLQNLNGPCPLLAITNVLLLAGKLTLHVDRNHVSYRHLVEMLGEFLFTQQHVESEAEALTREATISATLGLLPRLCHGLDVNVGFDSTEAFEYTQELACFDAFGVVLRHGWVVDPQAVGTAGAIGGKTYNVLQELLINAAMVREQRTPRAALEPEPEVEPEPKPADVPETDADELAAAIALSLDAPADASLEPPPPLAQSTEGAAELVAAPAAEPTGAEPAAEPAAEPVAAEPAPVVSPEQVAANEKLLLDAAQVEEFLEASRSQLTYHGLFELMRVVKPNAMCAFFRNCHFGVLHNHEGKLYILLTDAGYADVEGAVWEQLCEIDGDNVIVGSDFRVASHPATASQVQVQPPPTVQGTVVGTTLPPGARPAGNVVAGTVLPPVVGTLQPRAGSAATSVYTCEYNCGFRGSHTDVMNHERLCPLNPAAAQPPSDYVVDSQDYVVQPLPAPSAQPQAGQQQYMGGEDTDGDLALALQMQEEEARQMRDEEHERGERLRAAGIQ
jgi:hypothetical protein